MSHRIEPEGHWSVDLGGVHAVFGAGALERMGEQARDLVAEGTHVLVVTDPGLEAAGHVDRAVASLRDAGLDACVFDGVEENPTTAHAEAAAEAARACGAELLVGLGGGSSMDCCKAANFLVSNGGAMEDYWGVDKATKPMLPSIGVPTTAGTGSEAQRFALVSQVDSHRKMACGDKKARFRTVLLDPDLIATVPRDVAAVTAMDAVSHALESYVSTRRNPVSQLFARESWRLLERSFEPFLQNSDDAQARADMLLGAHLSGAAIEASMLGAAHSCANPLTARHGVVHGVAVGLMLPHVIRFNGDAVAGLYAELNATAGLNGHVPLAAPDRLAARVAELQDAAGLPRHLGHYGIDADGLGVLAHEAADQWTANFNPRRVDRDRLLGLYEAAL
ncbi:MAG: iron-containing alcohol dehydrogenase [Acidobacteriota bacterium]